MARTIIELSSLDETDRFGKTLAKELRPGDVLAFYGDIGAGKTTLIKSIVSSFSYPKSEITSPTFTYLNIYNAKLPIFHFDLYRFENEEEFLQKGFDEYFEANGICLVEWAEKIPSLLPKNTKKIFLKHKEGARACFVE